MNDNKLNTDKESTSIRRQALHAAQQIDDEQARCEICELTDCARELILRADERGTNWSMGILALIDRINQIAYIEH